MNEWALIVFLCMAGALLFLLLIVGMAWWDRWQWRRLLRRRYADPEVKRIR